MLQAHQQLNCRPGASQSPSRSFTVVLQSLPHLHAPFLTRHTRRHPPAVAAAAGPNHLPNRSTQGSTVRSPTHSELHQSAFSTNSSSSSSSWWSRLDWELLLLVSALPAPAALAAEDGLKYDSSRGEGIVKTLSGGLYIGLLLYFLFKVLNRRARKAREERIAGQGPVRTVFTTLIEKATEGKELPKATAGAAFIGAVQAGLIGFGLFTFSTRVEGQIYGSDLPNGYTAQNIAITVRTIIVGLLYLATFIFSANALGLTGLGIQLLLFPDSLPDDEPSPASRFPKEPQLPKVTVTSSPQEIKAAFEAVAREQSSSNGSSAGAAGSGSSSMSQAADAGGSSGRARAGVTGSADSSSEVDVIM